MASSEMRTHDSKHDFNLEGALFFAFIGFLIGFFAIGILFGQMEAYRREKLGPYYVETPDTPNQTATVWMLSSGLICAGISGLWGGFWVGQKWGAKDAY